MTARAGIGIGFAGLVLACGGGREATRTDRLANIVEVESYGIATCARDRHGDVYCWGERYESKVPKQIVDTGKIARLGASENPIGFATAVREDGTVVAWSTADVGLGHDRESSRARETGWKVDAKDLFADTGCLYTDGKLSCAMVPEGVDLPRLEKNEWRAEPGLVDLAVFTAGGAGVCLRYDDRRIQCSKGEARQAVELASKVTTMVGGPKVVLLTEDGRVARISGGRDLAFDDGVPDGVVSIDVSPSGNVCAIDRADKVTCWSPPGQDIAHRTTMTDVRAPKQAAASDALDWCVLEQSGEVGCAGGESFTANCKQGDCAPTAKMVPVPPPAP